MNVHMENIKTYHVIVVNTIPIFFGISLIVIGSIKRKDNIFELFKEDILNARQWCVFLGYFTVLSSVLGYVALITTGQATKWLRWLYYISTFIIICSLIACADMSRRIQQFILDHMILLYSQYSTDSDIKEKVDKFQRMLQCCGFTASTDQEVQEENSLVKSCCPKNVEICEKSKTYKTNCSGKTSSIVPFSNTITALALVTAIFLIILSIVILITKCQDMSQEQITTADDILVDTLDYTDFRSSISPSHAPSHAPSRHEQQSQH